MKKLALFALGFAMLLPASVKAQDSEMFNHLSLGVSLGTDGIGFEAAAPIGRYVQARTGISFMPAFSYSDDVKYGNNAEGTQDRKINFKGTLHMTDWKLLFDIYPTTKSSFHFTAGFYVGKQNVVTGKNPTPENILKNGGYVVIGGEHFGANSEGIANVQVRVNNFKPYLGIGFGRAVPRKHRFAVTCDLGVQFWGKPKVYSWNQSYKEGTETPIGFEEVDYKTLTDPDVEDAHDAIKAINGIFVYPVLNIRLNGRIF